ncbi:hypothetical protein H4I95_07266 [Botrytis cinerea]
MTSNSHILNPNPFITKSPLSSPSKSLPLSQGILLCSSSDPLAPVELRLVSLLSYPCTAIVNPISQSPSAYALVRAKNSNSNSMTGLGDSSTRIGMNIGIGVETPQISLPGLIDKSAGEDLAKWRESNWKEGLNAGGCGVSGSFGLGGVEEGKNGEIGMGTGEDERPKYIIHTHAPNFTDKAYSTPLVKQLLVNCYRGALVEAMGIAESEEKRERDDDMTDREGREKQKKEDASMRDTDTDANENILAEREITPEIPRKIGLRSFGTVNVAGSMSCPASLASPRDANLDTSGISPISSPSILPSKSIRPITSIPPILLSSPTSAPSVSHDPSKEHIPQTSPRPTGITIAFPAISTGHKSFPHRLAARIAVGGDESGGCAEDCGYSAGYADGGVGFGSWGEGEERYSSGFESSEGKRLSRGNEYLGDKESESVEDMDMDIEEEEEVEVEADIEKEVDMEAKKEVEKEVEKEVDDGVGTVERKTERSVDGEIEKEEVNPTKVADERVRRPEAGDGTASPKSISSIGERRAKQSKLKDKERQENKTAGNCIRRHGSTKTQNKQERGYTERKEVGDTKAGTKRGRPSKMDGSGTGGSDTERRGGRKKKIEGVALGDLLESLGGYFRGVE